MKRAMVLGVCVLALSACGGDDDSSDTTAAPTTVFVTQPATTSSPVPATAEPATSSTISRDARSAVLGCIDAIGDPGYFLLDASLGGSNDTDAAIDACDTAADQVQLDMPDGSLLAVTIRFLNVRLTGALVNAGATPTPDEVTAFSDEVNGDIAKLQELAGL